MLQKEDIKNLGILARIEVTDEEQEGLAKDLDSVLSYVSEIAQVTTEADIIPRVGEIKNVMRPDTDAYAGGKFTEMILENAPATENGYVKVKQIL